MDQRQAFEAFCKERYGGFDEEEDEQLGETILPMCKKSKTITKRKGERILNVLKNSSDCTYPPKFQYWVKHRGFKIISHPLLGIHDVLCLPAKRPVSC